MGLHLRTNQTLAGVAQEAIDCNLPFFQFFLTNHETGKYIHITTKDIDDFNHVCGQGEFAPLYIHSSYWINPATGAKHVLYTSRQLLRKELEIASQLRVPYLVLHAGSASHYPVTAEDGAGRLRAIETLAKTLDKVLKGFPDMTILLENSAYGGKTLGNSFDDFALLRQQTFFPERVAFCLDTAHAYAYGYDVKNLEEFVGLLDAKLGLQNIKLIHFNDLASKKGLMRDFHAFPGHGSIGKEALKGFLYHESLGAVPKILELPACNQSDSLQCLSDVWNWR